jgi:hypothetical protein
VKYPVGKAYELQFLKGYFQLVERTGQAIDDELMDLFMECLRNQPKMKEEGRVSVHLVFKKNKNTHTTEYFF